VCSGFEMRCGHSALITPPSRFMRGVEGAPLTWPPERMAATERDSEAAAEESRNVPAVRWHRCGAGPNRGGRPAPGPALAAVHPRPVHRITPRDHRRYGHW
jgi:hypothetical protein